MAHPICNETGISSYRSQPVEMAGIEPASEEFEQEPLQAYLAVISRPGSRRQPRYTQAKSMGAETPA